MEVDIPKENPDDLSKYNLDDYDEDEKEIGAFYSSQTKRP